MGTAKCAVYTVWHANYRSQLVYVIGANPVEVLRADLVSSGALWFDGHTGRPERPRDFKPTDNGGRLGSPSPARPVTRSTSANGKARWRNHSFGVSPSVIKEAES